MAINLLDDGGWLERTWPPERAGFVWRRKRVAGEHLGASLYELPPGESTFPYHYELGNDELRRRQRPADIAHARRRARARAW
jgi:hypothetical protein